MLNIFSLVGKNKKKEAKEVIMREFFNSSDQKKAVSKAARESAKDQKVLVEKYRKMVSVSQS